MGVGSGEGARGAAAGSAEDVMETSPVSRGTVVAGTCVPGVGTDGLESMCMGLVGSEAGVVDVARRHAVDGSSESSAELADAVDDVVLGMCMPGTDGNAKGVLVAVVRTR